MDFYQSVYDFCRKIPSGKLVTYGIVAKAIGTPGSARMVGWALNKSLNIIPPVTAHRVVNRMGILSGKKAFGNNNLMKELLEQEGHIVVNDKVVDFEKSLWIPK